MCDGFESERIEDVELLKKRNICHCFCSWPYEPPFAIVQGESVLSIESFIVDKDSLASRTRDFKRSNYRMVFDDPFPNITDR
jgi:hypothetical protein